MVQYKCTVGKQLVRGVMINVGRHATAPDRMETKNPIEFD